MGRKPESLGQLVRMWREASGFSVAEMARHVGVDYQKLQQLEKKPGTQPRYLADLAKAMGSTVDDLLALKMPPPSRPAPPAPAESGAAALHPWPLEMIPPAAWAEMSERERNVVDVAAAKALRDLRDLARSSPPQAQTAQPPAAGGLDDLVAQYRERLAAVPAAMRAERHIDAYNALGERNTGIKAPTEPDEADSLPTPSTPPRRNRKTQGAKGRAG